jgi:hypothetical protein
MGNRLSHHHHSLSPSFARPPAIHSNVCELQCFWLCTTPIIWTNNPIAFECSPNSYNELTALRHITCGCTLLQEFMWACSPHMNGPFRDYHQDIHICLPKATELIVLYFLRIQELSLEIFLGRYISGMQHKLLHHFVHNLIQNLDSGLTRSVLLTPFMGIKQLRRNRSHPTAPLHVTYHDVISQLRDANITHFQVRRSTSSVGDLQQHQDSLHDPIVDAAQLCPV